MPPVIIEWVKENYLLLLFAFTTFLAILNSIIEKKKAARLRKMLYQTFNNVEVLKNRWTVLEGDKRYGRIGQIFGKLNEKAGLRERIEDAYKKRK